MPALPSSNEGESINVITCFNCKRPGHIAVDCHDGSQQQTVPKERKYSDSVKKKIFWGNI